MWKVWWPFDNRLGWETCIHMQLHDFPTTITYQFFPHHTNQYAFIYHTTYPSSPYPNSLFKHRLLKENWTFRILSTGSLLSNQRDDFWTDSFLGMWIHASSVLARPPDNMSDSGYVRWAEHTHTPITHDCFAGSASLFTSALRGGATACLSPGLSVFPISLSKRFAIFPVKSQYNQLASWNFLLARTLDQNQISFLEEVFLQPVVDCYHKASDPQRTNQGWLPRRQWSTIKSTITS